MTRKLTALLATSLTLAAAGCGVERSAPNARADRPTTTTTTTTTTTKPVDDTLEFACQLMEMARGTKVINEVTAITGEPGPAMRSQVASIYSDFANQLTDVALSAPDELREVLIEWSAAAAEVGIFVSQTEPGPGIVISYGPANDRAMAAEDAAVELCGDPAAPSTTQMSG